ncbi:radical SAM protein [Alistipes ihumii]|uniref:radical SAM protein n=1 Tax=Alistipes ihumii TaxID=1470347 RepID=UPI002353A40E|nr:radical SAM protein [Alistipes ihumii]
MKWSRYNAILDYESYEVLYNCMNNNLVALDHKLRILLEENQECIERFENIHPEFYQYLLRKKFVIDDNVNEIDEAINLSRNYLNSKQTFYLIVNPTLDCNLRCWYCYETHLSSSIMDTTTMERVKRLMDRIISSSELVRFELGFFGGEPLMQFQSVVLPLIIYAQKACLRHQKELSIGFTSNGVYLTRPVVDKLTELMLTYRFQIPFDGNEYYHNKTKKYANGRGSYRHIIENVKYGATQGMVFNIRCNYTPENIASFKDLIAELKYLPSDIISFSFQRVWQTSETDDTRKVLTELDNMVAEGENAKKTILM